MKEVKEDLNNLIDTQGRVSVRLSFTGKEED